MSAEEPKLAGRIEEQRTQIFKAMSIIEACRLGSDSMLKPIHRRNDTDDDDDDDGEKEASFEGALAAAWDILDDICTALEGIAESTKDTT